MSDDKETPPDPRLDENQNFGRPPFFSDPDTLEKKIDEYFKSGMHMETRYTKEGQKYEVAVPTFTDLCLFLGFVSRQSFYAYEKKPQFTHVMQKARLMTERVYEIRLASGNPTGAIFALKNFDWKDQKEITHEGSGKDTKIMIVYPPDYKKQTVGSKQNQDQSDTSEDSNGKHRLKDNAESVPSRVPTQH